MKRKRILKRCVRILFGLCILVFFLLIWYSSCLTTYKVTFVIDGVEKVQKVRVNGKAEMPDFLKEGYTFIGWETEDGKIWNSASGIKGDLRVTAKYKSNEIYLTFLSGSDGSFENGSDKKVIVAEYGGEIVFPNALKEGYVVDYWLSDGGERFSADGKYTVSENESFTAVWKKSVTEILYDLDGGTKGSDFPTKIAYDEKYNFTKSIPTKRGYSFDGWETAEDYELKGTWRETVRSVTLKATWKAKVSQVSFDSDGGNAVSAKTFTFDRELSESDFEVPVKDGCVFIGWFYDEIDIRLWRFWNTESEKVTLTARWADSEKTVRFSESGNCVDGDKGEVLSVTQNPSVKARYDKDSGKYTLKTEVPTALSDGGCEYGFVCWCLNGEACEISDERVIALDVDEDVTLNARWNTLKYTFNGDLSSFASTLKNLPSIKEIVLPYDSNVNELFSGVDIPLGLEVITIGTVSINVKAENGKLLIVT